MSIALLSKDVDNQNFLDQTQLKLQKQEKRELSKWEKLGLKAEWFSSDPQGASTLLSTRLIYPIIGFCNTKNGRLEDEIRFNGEKNGIEIRVENEFCLVRDNIRSRFIFSSEGGGTIQEISTQKNWTYLEPKGLVPVDRWSHDEFLPVITLKKEQMDRLREHAQVKNQNDNIVENPYFIQIVTNPRELCFSPNTLTEHIRQNYKNNFPLHAWVRLIDKDGKVYSTGFGSAHDEDMLQEKLGYFSTINGVPTILDYEEFRPHEGRVTTTFAISEDKFKKTLEAIQKDRKNTIRFNILAQNCNTLAIKYLTAAGIEFPSIKMTIRELLYELLPKELRFQKSIAFLRKYTPTPLKLPIQVILKILVTCIEYLISFLILNPVFLIQGLNRKSPLSQNKSTEDQLIQNKQIIRFFSNAFNLEVEFSLRTLQAQFSESLSKGNTWTHSYNGPNMSIIPPQRNDITLESDLALEGEMAKIYQN